MSEAKARVSGQSRGFVFGLVEHSANPGVDVLRALDPRQTLIENNAGDPRADIYFDLQNVVLRREQHPLAQLLLGHLFGDAVCGLDPHLIRDPFGPSRINAEAQSGENIKIVGLSGDIGFFPIMNGRKLNARGKNRAAVRPLVSFFRRAFRVVRRIREREDNGPGIHLCHRLDHALVESFRLRADADEDCRFEFLDRGHQILRRRLFLRIKLLFG